MENKVLHMCPTFLWFNPCSALSLAHRSCFDFQLGDTSEHRLSFPRWLEGNNKVMVCMQRAPQTDTSSWIWADLRAFSSPEVGSFEIAHNISREAWTRGLPSPPTPHLWRAQPVLTQAVFISTPLPRTPPPGPVCFSLVGTDPWVARLAGGLTVGRGRKEGRRETPPPTAEGCPRKRQGPCLTSALWIWLGDRRPPCWAWAA